MTSDHALRLAYADPPYLGQCGRYGHRHEDGCWDEIPTHAALVDRLIQQFPDGWALSLSTPSLWDILPFIPRTARLGAWVKPWANFKPGVGLTYAWEPLVISGGRRIGRHEESIFDWVKAMPAQMGFHGAKPEEFCFWLFRAWNARIGDDLTDLFHGSGAVKRAWEKFHGQLEIAL